MGCGFYCQECGHAFRTVKAAERASTSLDGCPGCGGADIDLGAPAAASSTASSKVFLFSTFRGLRLAVSLPDIRYAQYHTVYVAQSESAGDCVLVRTPEKRNSAGAITVGAGSHWDPRAKRPGNSIFDAFVDPSVKVGTWTRGKGFDAAGRPGIYCALFASDGLGARGSAVFFADEDPEVAAIVAEVAALDAEWKASHVDALRREAVRTDAVARACALEGLPIRATETECLECGAVYSQPGHVEAGGMACDRCGQ